MKIIYLGATASSDSDLPLIKELTSQGVDVYAYFYMSQLNKSSGLFNITNLKKVDDILPISSYAELSYLNKFVNLEKTFIINNFHAKRRNWQFWLLRLKTLHHMKKLKADVFHYIWPLSGCDKIYYWLNLPKILTVHDPIPHSGQFTKIKEKERILAFSKANRLVFLSDELVDQFSNVYGISRNQIFINKMGAFDYLNEMPIKNDLSQKYGRYILYFGQIQPHKGIEYLIDAMKVVHNKLPWLNLVIAGKGVPYFDVTEIEKTDYITFINRYINTNEMTDLLRGCLYMVCPYKDATQSGVVISAFSMYVPLIVTSVGNMHKQVENGIEGIVVPPCNSEKLSDAIIELANSPEKIETFKNNIKTKWYKNMGWSSIVKKYISLYEDVISKN